MKHNILFHALNGIGLGHIRRALAIASELSESENIGQIVFLTNSSHTEIIKSAGYIVEHIDVGIEDTLGKVSFQEYEQSTGSRLKEIVTKYDITAVIHDTFFIHPFVKEQKDIVHFLVLRDSDLVYLKQISTCFPFFQKIFYPHRKSELHRDKLRFLKNFGNIEFTNYVVTKKSTRLDIEKDTILISPGLGGDKDAVLRFFTYILQLLGKLNERANSQRMVLVLGKHAGFLRENLKFPKDLIVYDFLIDIESELQRSILFLGRGGYNTLNEILAHNIPALLFPVERVAENQSARIRYFAEKINFLRKGVYDFAMDIASFSSLLAIRNIKPLSPRYFSGGRKISTFIESELQKKKVLIFRHIFLPLSEHFLKEEFLSFKKINPVFLTLQLEKETDMPEFSEKNLVSSSIFQPLLTPDYPAVRDNELYIRFLKFVASFIKKNRIKTIYTPFLFDAHFLLPLKKIIPGIQIFSGARGYDVYSYLSKINNPTQLLSGLDGILVRDTVMRGFLKQLAPTVPEATIRIVRSVLSFKKYTFSPLPISSLKILIGGRFVEKKGMIPLLQLLEKLHDIGCPIETVGMVGSGPLQSEIDRIINQSALKERFIRYGFLDHQELLGILPKYNCHISYSRKSTTGDDEGIPNLLLENILSGNIVFSTLTGGISEILENGKTGFVLSGDIDQDATTIFSTFTILQTSHFLYNNILKTARKRVYEIYAPKHSSKLLENILLRNYEQPE